MHIGVIEPDGGLRGVLRFWMKDEGYTATGYMSSPVTYDNVDLILFGPSFVIPQKDIEILEQKEIPYIRVAHFDNMEVLLERIATVQQQVRQRADQYIAEDR